MARIKREQTVSETGLATPAASFHSTPAPKSEHFDHIDLTQESVQPFINNFDGLPSVTGAAAAADRIHDQSRRSVSVSFRPIPPPPRLPLLQPVPEPVPQPIQPIQHHQPAASMPPNNHAHPETGLGVVGRDVKRLVEFTEKLKRIGLSTADKILPELVLVGDQSAGKSSLMGAIAEISLPKGQSMCTRCPTNVKTSEATAWTCSVSLRLSYYYEPSRKSGQAFPNWRRRDEAVTQLFQTINDKRELEEVLKRAQLAILNPSHPHDPSALRSESPPQAQFSPNVICVDIAGPGLPELSFYDLPGLFQTAEDPRQQYLVGVFEKLTAEYIKHENALIICALTMQNDPGLSFTKGVISKYKADHRCIGVLTMPDRLQGESKHADYDKILKGEAYKLIPHGYYVTKQPGPDSTLTKEPNFHALARREEEAFFDSNPLWHGEWSNFRHRCGTKAIQEVLSKEFAALILQSIPDVKHKISAQSREVDEELATMPEVPDDKVQHIVRQHLSDFSSEVKSILDGNGSNLRVSNFQGEWMRLCTYFQATLEAMRPRCTLSTKSDSKPEIIALDDDSDATEESPSKRQKLGSSVYSSIHSSPRGPPQTPVHQARYLFKQEESRHGSPRPRGLKQFKRDDFGPFYQPYLALGIGSMSLDEIRQAIKNQARTGLPGYVSPKVQEDQVLSAICAWDQPLDTFLTETFKLLRKEVLMTLEGVLRQFEGTSLFRRSRKIVDDFLLTQEGIQSRLSKDFYEVETSSLFTVNEAEFKRHKNEAFAQLNMLRMSARVGAFKRKNPNWTSKHKDEEKIKKEIEELLGPDPFAAEMDVVAYIRGYYATARLRFTDTVCANLHVRYIRKIKAGIKGLLENELGLNGSGDSEALCRALLEGNEDTSRKRTALLKKKQQLLEFSAALAELDRDLNHDNLEDTDMDIDSSVTTNGYRARGSTVGIDDDDSITATQTPFY